MTEHVHGCLTCRPDMVPDFDRADPRYHDGQKCGSAAFATTLDGQPIEYTAGVFEGREGWVLFAGRPGGDTHACPTCGDHVCVEPRFGRVEVVHGCTARVTARVERLKDALWPLVPEETFWRLLHGEDGP